MSARLLAVVFALCASVACADEPRTTPSSANADAGVDSLNALLSKA